MMAKWISGILLLLLCSCELRDPSSVGTAPQCPGTKWTLCSPVIPDYIQCCQKQMPEEGEVLTGSRLIDIALCNNPQTREAWAMARSAAFNWRATKSEYYPNIVANEYLDFNEQKFSGISGASDINNNIPGGGSVSGFNGYTQSIYSTLTLTYLVLDFGGRDATVEAARQALLAANWTNNRTIQTVILDVLNAYYQYLAAVSQEEAQVKDLEDAKANYKAAEKMFEVGLQTILDVLQTKTELLQAERDLVEAQGLVKETMGQLASVLGFPADRSFRVQPLPEDLPVHEVREDVESLMVQARKDRPDFAAAYANLLETKAEVVQARSNALPTVSTEVDLQKINNIHNPKQNGHIYDGIVQLNIPLFSGFLYLNQIKEALANADAADASLRNTELQVYLDVWNAYTSLQTAVETIKFTKELLLYSQEAYAAALTSYKEGTGDILEVLNTQARLADARAEWIESRTQWVTSLVALAYAVGTL